MTTTNPTDARTFTVTCDNCGAATGDPDQMLCGACRLSPCLSAYDSDEAAALGREELALAGTSIPQSAERSCGHIAFHADSAGEYYVSLGGVNRASWFDEVVPFRGGFRPFPGGATGYRPAQYVCTVHDALFARPAAASLPAEVVTAIRKASGL